MKCAGFDAVLRKYACNHCSSFFPFVNGFPCLIVENPPDFATKRGKLYGKLCGIKNFIVENHVGNVTKPCNFVIFDVFLASERLKSNYI